MTRIEDLNLDLPDWYLAEVEGADLSAMKSDANGEEILVADEESTNFDESLGSDEEDAGSTTNHQTDNISAAENENVNWTLTIQDGKRVWKKIHSTKNDSKNSAMNSEISSTNPYNCLLKSNMHLSEKLKYPEDAYEHAKEFYDLVKSMNVPQHTYADYSGPWIENVWIEKFSDPNLYFSKEKLNDEKGANFGHHVPLFIPWTDIWASNSKEYSKFLSKIKSMIRPDVPYVTVAQNEVGMGGMECKDFSMPNILVFAPGGYGHVPIPLLKADLYSVQANLTKIQEDDQINKVNNPTEFENRNSDPSPFFTFYGTNTSYVRPNVCMSIQKFTDANKIGNLTDLNLTHQVCQLSPDWQSKVAKSKIGLSPRGLGRSSFMTAEIVQLETVPWYVYDDEPWVPYERMWDKIGFSSKMEDFENELENFFKSHDYDAAKVERALSEKEEFIRSVKESHFSYDGIVEQMRLFLKNPSKSDLV